MFLKINRTLHFQPEAERSPRRTYTQLKFQNASEDW